MVTKTANELRRLTRQILEAAGAVPDQAEIVAEHLVLANLRGVDSHGVWHIEGYVQAIRDGHIRVSAEPKIARETPASALVQGDWAFGHVVGRFAMQTAIEKARKQGVAVVSLVQTHHIGRLGHYAEMAAAEGMVSMVWAGGQGAEKPAAVPYGGRKALFHTNPIAMGLPTGSEPPVIIDFATSATAGRQSGQCLQPESAASPQFRCGQGRQSHHRPPEVHGWRRSSAFRRPQGLCPDAGHRDAGQDLQRGRRRSRA